MSSVGRWIKPKGHDGAPPLRPITEACAVYAGVLVGPAPVECSVCGWSGCGLVIAGNGLAACPNCGKNELAITPAPEARWVNREVRRNRS